MAASALRFRQSEPLYFRQLGTAGRRPPTPLYFRGSQFGSVGIPRDWRPSAPYHRLPSVPLRVRSKAPARRHMWRDWPLAKGLLVWMAFGLSVLFYFSDWPRTQPPTAVVAQVSSVSDGEAEELYTGSILVTGEAAGHCWERRFDNRTGAMTTKDEVNCTKAAPQETTERMRILRAYFRNRETPSR